MRRARRATAALAALFALLAVLTACADDGYVPSGPWRAQLEPDAGGGEPQPDPGQPPGGETTPPPSGQEDGDPNVVATGLTVPWGLALLPDGTALVGEKGTGRVLKVFPDASPAQELMTVPGIDPTGDGGLLGLAVSPTFDQDGLVYAYLTTPEDNRVVRFPIGGTPNPVLTGIPKGPDHNGGQLAFGPDGHLYVGTGDTGNPALAADPASLAGKVLRIDVFGKPPADNPDPASAVFTSGHSNVTGLCFDPQGVAYSAEGGQGNDDELNQLTAGASYGWPNGGGNEPAVTYPATETGIAACAMISQTVVVGALDGQKLLSSVLDANGKAVSDPEDIIPDKYGRLRTVALDQEGFLWVTTSNKDGKGQPVPDDDRVLRIQPPPTAGGGGVT